MRTRLKISAEAIEQGGRTMRAFGKKFQTHRPVFRGNVVGVVTAPPETGGQVIRANVRLANGTILPNVSVAGWGIGEGSHVSVRGNGSVLNGDFEIARVHTWGMGIISGNPHTPFSTPNIYDITSTVLDTNGTLSVVLNVTVECVVEHWRGRVPTRYIVEVLDENLRQVDWIESSQYERTAGKNRSEIGAGASLIRVNPYSGSGAPSLNFPRQSGVLRGGAELMYYELGNPDGSGFEFLSLDRGYFGTTPQIQYVDRDISLAGITFSTQGLLTNTVYKIRVMAKAADGRMSNWSDVVTVLTDVDTTPPTWSSTANLAVESIGSAFRLRWDDADMNTLDLSHYNIQISNDGVTWGDIYNAGNGNFWTYPATPGTIKYFRIQAEDYTGNTGYILSPFAEWSPSVRGVVILTEEPNGGSDAMNLITNGKFTTNLTGYSIVSSSGTATITRDTTVYFLSAPSSMRWQETRNGVLQSTSEISYTLPSVSGGAYLYLRGYIRRNANFTNTDDIVGIGLRITNPTLGISGTPLATIPGSEIPANGNWMPLFLEIPIPSTFVNAQLLITITNDNGSGTPMVYFDDLYLTRYSEGAAPFVAENSFSSDPGVNSRPLKSTASGGLTLEDLLVNDTITTDLLEAASIELGGVDLDSRLDTIESNVTALARFHMRYSTNAGQNLTSGTNVVVDYEDLGFQSVSYVTTGASWKFQPTVAGIYRIYASLQLSSNNWTAADLIQIGVFKNGSAVAFSRVYLPTMTAQIPQITISEMVSFNGSTDYIDIRGGGIWAGGGNRALSTDNRMNYVHIDRI